MDWNKLKKTLVKRNKNEVLCDSCIHYIWDNDINGPMDEPVQICNISKGLDCYHNRDEPWKHYECPEFLSEKDMEI